MQTVMSEQLRQERQRLRLASTCEECEHFVDDREVCDLLYPTGPHRRAAFDSARDGDRMSFCKMFEARAREAARTPPAPTIDGQD